MIITAHIGLSYRCNMSCKHCFVEVKKNRIDLDSMKKTIDVLCDNGLFFLFHTYGEPLMNNDFFNLAEYVRNKGVIQTLMTNGYYIDNDVVEKIKAVGIDRVMISLDSHLAVEHDSNRGVSGAWDKAIEAIKLIKSKELKVGIAFTITNSNKNSMDDVVKIAEELKVERVSFLRCRDDNKLVKIENENDYFKRVERLISQDCNGIEYTFHDFRLLPTIEKLYNENLISESKFTKYRNMNKCSNDTVINISPSGDVFKCGFNDIKIGNVLDESFDSILEKYDNTKVKCEYKEMY